MNPNTQRGERIKQERSRLGLSQQKAADAAGVRREMWAKYEAGAEPGADPLEGMRRLGIDVDYVLSGRSVEDRAHEAAAGLPARLRALREQRGLEDVLRVAGVTAKQWASFEAAEGAPKLPQGVLQRLIEGFRLDPAVFLLGRAESTATAVGEEAVLLMNYRSCSSDDQEAIRHQAAFLANRSGGISRSLTQDGRYPKAGDETPRTVHERRKKTL